MTEYFLPPVLEWHMGCALYRRPVVEAVLEHDLRSRGGGTSIWEPRLHVHKADSGYTARLVTRMGETVENFIEANASVAVTGDREQFKKGRRVTAKLFCDEQEIKLASSALGTDSLGQ